MPEENTEVAAVTQEQLDAVQSKLDEALSSIESVSGKNSELLGKLRDVKDAKIAAADEARTKSDALNAKNGDFEALFKSSQEKQADTMAQLTKLQDGISSEKRNNAALKIASSMADGFNAELLSEQISKRIKYSEGGVKVLNEAGELTVSTVAELTTEFKNNKRFASLLRGSQASGGNAAGGKTGGDAAKIKTRDDFNGLDQQARGEFLKSGGKIEG